MPADQVSIFQMLRLLSANHPHETIYIHSPNLFHTRSKGVLDISQGVGFVINSRSDLHPQHRGLEDQWGSKSVEPVSFL